MHCESQERSFEQCATPAPIVIRMTCGAGIPWKCGGVARFRLRGCGCLGLGSKHGRLGVGLDELGEVPIETARFPP
jgi:hypothetical protein